MPINDPNQERCRLAPLEAFNNEVAPKDLRRLQPGARAEPGPGAQRNGQSRVRVPVREGNTVKPEGPPPYTDPWDPAYDETYARSGIYRNDITVLPAERFTDEPMAEDRKRELLGEWYAKSVQTGARNSITVEGRFAQVCCGWPTAPKPAELYDAIRPSEPDERQRAVFTTWLCECDQWELLRAWADGMHTLRELVTAMYRHGWENGPQETIPQQLRTTAEAEARWNRDGLSCRKRLKRCCWPKAVEFVRDLMSECAT